jgi:hypothetical protein
VAGIAAGLAGCGAQTRRNELRPPTPITITAAIHDDAVHVSPTHFGAGPIVLVISNQSSSAQRVTFETDELGGSTGGIQQTTTAISPQDTGQLQVDVRRGSYRIRVHTRAIRAAEVRVGAERPSAQDALLQP